MTYMLLLTICAVTGPGEVSCDTVAGHLRKEKSACDELRKPMLEHLSGEAKAAGLRVIYLSARCKRGLDA